MSRRRQPLDEVTWRDPSTMHANGYNPNKVFTPEMQLLKTSILEDGWTQPVVVNNDLEIVDGFHRWTLASTDSEVNAFSGGLVPTVMLKQSDKAQQIMATVRHNRARGAHGVLKMADIVSMLRTLGLDDNEICARMGMEPEEVERLGDHRSSPDGGGKDSFGRGWVPTGG